MLTYDNYRGRVRLTSVRESILSAIISIDRAKALEIADDFAFKGDGIGYYLIAKISYNEENIEESLKFIDKALSCDSYPPSVIILKMKILLNFDNPPYNSELLKLADTTIPEKSETWESALFKGVIYSINGFLKPKESL